MTRTQAPEHGVVAGSPAALAPDHVAAEVERLRRVVLECAMQLLEGDWRAAARSAYAAAWSFHRLPRAEQEAFVVSDLHDDDGPIAVTDDWSASAFAAWLIWRANRSMEGERVKRRKLTAATESPDAEGSRIAESATDAPATPDSTQESLFDMPVKAANVRGRL